MLRTTVTLVWALLRVASASYVPCEPCGADALAACPPLPTGCRVVKESGCGCCFTCALGEGEACGVYTGTCAAGLRCMPRRGEEQPLHALLNGRGACVDENLELNKLRHPANKDGSQDDDLPLLARIPLHSHADSRKVQAMRRDRRRHQSKLRTVVRGDDLFTIMEKPQYEIGPCQKKLDDVIQRMKVTSRITAFSLYLPNCDKKGFFKHKQCKPSRWRKRGVCWCVDETGVQMPGTESKGGDVRCRGLQSNTSKDERWKY